MKQIKRILLRNQCTPTYRPNFAVGNVALCSGCYRLKLRFPLALLCNLMQIRRTLIYCTVAVLNDCRVSVLMDTTLQELVQCRLQVIGCCYNAIYFSFCQHC